MVRKNGLMLHHSLQEKFNDGEMLIIPDLKDQNEFISVILSQELLADPRGSSATDAPYSTLHLKRLRFQTAARPGKRYLYMHALLSLFRRCKYDVRGWENDREQVLTREIWGTLTKILRKSFLKALALELGDSWEGFEGVDGLAEFPDAKSPEEERTLATVIRYSLEHRSRNEDSEDEDSEDEDSEDKEVEDESDSSIS